MNLQILLIFPTYGLLITSCHGLDSQVPSFLDDSLHVDKETAKVSFREKLLTLLNSLPAPRHCPFVAQLAIKLGVKFSRIQDLLAKLENSRSSSRFSTRIRRYCRESRSKVGHFTKLLKMKATKKLPVGKAKRLEIILQELPSLYNNLPLPFQCEMLFEVGRRSILKPFEASENSVNSVTKLSLYEVGDIIKKAEKTLTEDISIVRVADRCVKVLAGKKHRTTDIIIAVGLKNAKLKAWKRGFRKKMQWIMGRFAKNNGIKLDNLHNLTSKDNLPFSAYFTHILNTSRIGNRVEVKFHMHLIKANSRALEARFALAALDALDKISLVKILDVDDVKYWAEDHSIGTGISSIHSYTLKMLFPAYLRYFFNITLRKHERCLIKHFVIRYSNSSNEKVMGFFKRKKINVTFPCSIMNGVISVVLSPKKHRGNHVVPKTNMPVGKTTPRIHKFHPGKKSKHPNTKKMEQVKKKFVHYRKATIIEIVMFVLLGSLSIVLIVFFITCVLFIVRKRRFRKHLQSVPNLGERVAAVDQSQLVVDSLRRGTQSSSECVSENQTVQDASSRQCEVRGGCAVMPRDGAFLHDKRSKCEKILNVTLEPLRFSTDDEESRCDDEETPRFSPTSGIFEPSSIYLGGKRLVPAVRYSKALARRRVQSDNERSVLEMVPEKQTFEVGTEDKRGIDPLATVAALVQKHEVPIETSDKEASDTDDAITRDDEGLKIHRTDCVTTFISSGTKEPDRAHQLSPACACKVNSASENTRVDSCGCTCRGILVGGEHSLREKSRYKDDTRELPSLEQSISRRSRTRKKRRKRPHSRSAHTTRKEMNNGWLKTGGSSMYTGLVSDRKRATFPLQSSSSVKYDLEERHGTSVKCDLEERHGSLSSCTSAPQTKDVYIESNSKRFTTL